jgi:hypothetical protein
VYGCAAGWAIAEAADWYGLPTPKVTEPSRPTSGVSQAPPEPILLAVFLRRQTVTRRMAP